MQMHKQKTIKFEDVSELLKGWLPYHYVNKVLDFLNMEDTETNRVAIRRVRYGRAKNLDILLALVEIANENRKANERIKEILEEVNNS